MRLPQMGTTRVADTCPRPKLGHRAKAAGTLVPRGYHRRGPLGPRTCPLGHAAKAAGTCVPHSYHGPRPWGHVSLALPRMGTPRAADAYPRPLGHGAKAVGTRVPHGYHGLRPLRQQTQVMGPRLTGYHGRGPLGPRPLGHRAVAAGTRVPCGYHGWGPIGQQTASFAATMDGDP